MSMAIHTATDAQTMAEILQGNKSVVCEKHGEVSLQFVAPYYVPSFPFCMVCFWEWAKIEFPVHVVDKCGDTCECGKVHE